MPSWHGSLVWPHVLCPHLKPLPPHPHPRPVGSRMLSWEASSKPTAFCGDPWWCTHSGHAKAWGANITIAAQWQAAQQVCCSRDCPTEKQPPSNSSSLHFTKEPLGAHLGLAFWTQCYRIDSPEIPAPGGTSCITPSRLWVWWFIPTMRSCSTAVAFKKGRVVRWAWPNWGRLRRPGSSWKQTLSVRGTGHGGSAVGFEDGGGHTVREVHSFRTIWQSVKKQGPQSYSCKELSSTITSELREPRALDEITATNSLISAVRPWAENCAWVSDLQSSGIPVFLSYYICSDLL